RRRARVHDRAKRHRVCARRSDRVHALALCGWQRHTVGCDFRWRERNSGRLLRRRQGNPLRARRRGWPPALENQTGYHPASIITATPRFYGGVIYQPVSSYEEAIAAKPDYQCCTFRGSVVALDAGTGRTIWQSFTITQAPAPTRTNP